MNYPKKPGFNLYQLRHCAYITFSVKTWFLKNLSVCKLFKERYVDKLLNWSGVHRVCTVDVKSNEYNYSVYRLWSVQPLTFQKTLPKNIKRLYKLTEYLHLFTYTYVCQFSIFLSIYLSIYIYVYLSIYISNYIHIIY